MIKLPEWTNLCDCCFVFSTLYLFILKCEPHLKAETTIFFNFQHLSSLYHLLALLEIVND